jgi:hypothetical protein
LVLRFIWNSRLVLGFNTASIETKIFHFLSFWVIDTSSYSALDRDLCWKSTLANSLLRPSFDIYLASPFDEKKPQSKSIYISA